MSRGQSGSRFLYDPFETTQHRVDMAERVAQEKWSALEYRLGLIETALERLDRRLWLMVFGILATILTEAVQGILVHAI